MPGAEELLQRRPEIGGGEAVQVQQWQHLGHPRRLACPRGQDHRGEPLPLPEVDETEMLTVWIAITDATIENGCLCVVPKSHMQGLAVHCPSIGIPEVLRGPEFTPLPVKRGDVIFMHRRTMHSSLTNESDGVRWSLDLRYQPIGQPTGRPVFPAFVVRSRRRPESEVHDWRVWGDLWRTARSNLAHQPAWVRVEAVG